MLELSVAKKSYFLLFFKDIEQNVFIKMYSEKVFLLFFRKASPSAGRDAKWDRSLRKMDPCFANDRDVRLSECGYSVPPGDQ